MVSKRTAHFSACCLVKLSAGIILHLKTYLQGLRSLVEGVHYLAVTEKRKGIVGAIEKLFHPFQLCLPQSSYAFPKPCNTVWKETVTM